MIATRYYLCCFSLGVIVVESAHETDFRFSVYFALIRIECNRFVVEIKFDFRLLCIYANRMMFGKQPRHPSTLIPNANGMK